MKLLHLDSSSLGAHSVSRVLSARLAAREQALDPSLDVRYRDLAADPLLHLSCAHLAALQGADADAVLAADLARGNAHLEELIAADVVIIGAPMYNLSVPSALKAWIDRVSVAGKSFRYTATGPEGLLTGKKVYIASARGGIYSAGSAGAALDHQERYLIDVLGILGMRDVTVLRAEGLALGPEAKDAAISHALSEIAALPA